MNYAERYIRSKDWAMLEEYVQLLLAIGTRDEELREESLDAVVKRYGRSMAGTRNVTIRDGVAVVPVIGPVFRYANFFTEISGATAYERLGQDFAAAVENPDVHHVVLEINSPGGEVDGTSEMAQLIAGAEKPVTAFVGHLGASAAMWLASAADRVYLADTAMVGSIGVVATVAGPRDGKVPTMEFVSSQSPKKRLDPFKDGDAGAEARREIQNRVNAMADVFIRAVAQGRGMTPEAVAATEGALFVGSQAVEAGLADGVTTLEALLTSLAAGGDRRSDRMAAEGGNIIQEESMEIDFGAITLEELEANRPDLVNAITDRGRSAGATAERERILKIHGIKAEGFDSLKADLMADPAVSPGDAALRILNAKGEKEARLKQSGLDALAADEDVVAEVAPATGATEDEEAAAVVADIAAHANNWRENRPGF